jgi:hypothetical protein
MNVVSRERRRMKSFLDRRARAVARPPGHFGRDDAGNVAIIFALVGVVLMLCIGAAVDVGRWLHARDQTVSAIDAAVLAGGRLLQTNSSDEAAAIAAATKYYKENVTSRLPVMNDTVAFNVADDGMGMTGSGSAYIKAVPALRRHRKAATGQPLADPICQVRDWRQEHRSGPYARHHWVNVQLAAERHPAALQLGDEARRDEEVRQRPDRHRGAGGSVEIYD